jgi:hypothetical protein
MMRIPTATAVALALACPAGAQESDALALRREMQAMRAQYEKLMQSYESRLGELEQRLKAADAKTAAPAPTPAPAAAPLAAAQPPSGAPAASASAFNPAIGVVLDGKFGAFSRNPDDYRMRGFAVPDEGRSPGIRGFALGESEINLSANIDQALYGNLTISFERTGDVSVEEAFLQTSALPWGFTLKAGRFFSGIGYLNEQHGHAWDFADQALPYRAFLNTQLGDDGVQLRWLAPLPLFLELGAEVLRGDAFPGAAPGHHGVGSYSVFAHLGDDIGAGGELGSWRAGVSHLRSRPRERADTDNNLFTGRSNLTILDAVYKLPLENERSLKLQGEYFLRDEAGNFNGADYAGRQTGFYMQGVWRFLPRWDVALRYDQIHANNDGIAVPGSLLETAGTGTLRRYSTALSFYTSEFGRFRAQYNLDEVRPNSDHQFFLQYTINLGAHGAHQY